MHARRLAMCVALVLSGTGLALAQAPTPTPVDSNVAVSSFAQSRGQDLQGAMCTSRGAAGCGGCYPASVSATDPTAMLALVNPEWAPIGPMISGLDASLPPVSQPVLITGTVTRSKINIGGDFPASHQGDDQNTDIAVDPDKHGLLGTGNVKPGCVGTECTEVKMEWEINKYPLFAWAGEGDRITALGRWVFDCGHQRAGPLGKCSNDPSKDCVIDADCGGGGTCDMPSPSFSYRSELHPPQAVAVIRNKSIGRRPATRADVYISADGGGAGDRCTVTHSGNATDVLLVKDCFKNHCSVTTSRSCQTDKDCAKSETCVLLDPNERLADVNASDFEFDMPLPLQPQGATKVKIKAKKIRIKGVKGSQMPKPTFQVTLSPTPNVHVIVPMTVPVKGQLPSVFAESISAAWKGDKTKLKKVQVKVTGITINNPLKASTPPVPRLCTDPAGGPSQTACDTDADCTAVATGACANRGKPCQRDSDCPATDFCQGGSRCAGGLTPGWEAFVQVNGDWARFASLEMVGAEAPFAAPPYVQPPTPLTIKQKLRFKEFVASDGSVRIATTGHSLNCVDDLYGKNLIDDVNTIGLTAGAACLVSGGDPDPGRVDVTFTGPDFATPVGSPTTCTPAGKFLSCTTTSEGGVGGTCSGTTNRLCVADADCPMGETCNVTGAAFALQYTIKVK